MRMNTRQWLERLTAFDTTSRLSNLGLIETVRGLGYRLNKAQ